MINGIDRIFYIKWEDEFLPIGLQLSDSFEENSETIDTTTRDGGGWKTSVPTNQSYSINIEGLVINTFFNGGDFSKISYDRLRYLKRNRQLIEWETRTKDLLFVDSGKGHIINLSDGANIDEFISFSATIEGYGKPNSQSKKAFNYIDNNNNLIVDNNEKIITT